MVFRLVDPRNCSQVKRFLQILVVDSHSSLICVVAACFLDLCWSSSPSPWCFWLLALLPYAMPHGDRAGERSIRQWWSRKWACLTILVLQWWSIKMSRPKSFGSIILSLCSYFFFFLQKTLLILYWPEIYVPVGLVEMVSINWIVWYIHQYFSRGLSST